jgi:hypothetical protein
MPDAAHRVMFEFKPTTGAVSTAGSQNGWTETWYDPVITNAQTALLRARLLLNLRRGILSHGWSIASMRISQLTLAAGLLRLGSLYFVPPADQPGTYGGGDLQVDDQPYDALECAVVGVNGHHRSFQMRGVPSDVVSPGAQFLNNPRFINAFASWKSFLNGAAINAGPGGAWAIKIRLNPAAANLMGVQIPTPPLGGADPQHPLLSLYSPDVVPTPGMFISIRGALGNSRLNGTWQIRGVVPAVPAFTFNVLLFSKRRVTVGGVYASGGDCRLWTTILEAIADITPGYGTSRRTGRPSALVRGRRSNRQ